jgi:aminoglycoside phosphotransferase (APT) family kinase protein
MTTPADAEALVRAVRPGLVLHRRPSALDDELVLAGGGEVFRLPLATSAVQRAAVLVQALPKLRPLLPVALPSPRYVGVLADGATPFTAEARLPGVRPRALASIALAQLEGVVEALLAVSVREAQQWGVSGDGPALVHGALGLDALLADPRTGLLTGVVDWQLQLAAHVDALEADLAALL